MEKGLSMKNKRISEKGYTLLELLAVLVILGILTAIAVPTITRVIAITKDQAFVGNAITLKEAATLFLKDQEVEGATINKITYKELYDLNFMEEIIDPYTGQFIPLDKSYVELTENKVTAVCFYGENRNLCLKDGKETAIPIEEISIDLIKLNN
jgi:type IV pilus assembly protein PilA